MTKTTNKWVVSVETRDHKIKLSIYQNGLVYSKERNKKLGILKKEAMEEIEAVYKPYLSILRRERYITSNFGKFIIRINDIRRTVDTCMKFIHPMTDKIVPIIIKKDNYIKIF